MIGRVVSIKMNQTAAVLVTSTKTHPLYKKSFTRNKKYLAQDDLGVKEGDIVEIVKISPMSKRKHWQVKKVVGRDIEKIAEAELKEQAAAVIEEVMPEDQPVSEAEKPETQKKKLVKNKKETK